MAPQGQARVSGRSKTSARSAPARPQPRNAAARRAERFRLSPVLVVWGVVVLAAAALVVVFATSERAQGWATDVQTQVATSMGGAGFVTRRIVVQGAGPQTRAAVLAAAGVPLNGQSTTVDLAAVRGRVESIPSLSGVRVMRLLPDTLVISVQERPRLAVWQRAGRLSVIDSAGRVIGEANPAAFPDLPLVVGAGAPEAAAALIAQMENRPRLTAATRALVRVDGRRWNLHLRDGGVILLPATDTAAALNRLDDLDRRTRLLELGFERIDLREPSMTAVRPRPRPAGASAAPAARPSAAAPAATAAPTPPTPNAADLAAAAER